MRLKAVQFARIQQHRVPRLLRVEALGTIQQNVCRCCADIAMGMSAYRHVPCPLHLKITSSESLHPVVTILRFPGSGVVELVESVLFLTNFSVTFGKLLVGVQTEFW